MKASSERDRGSAEPQMKPTKTPPVQKAKERPPSKGRVHKGRTRS
jgi:hypothetical protein